MAVLGDPEGFPITADQSRTPMNWYGRTKLLNERAIETLAEDAFPAHQFLKSNLYGEHVVDGTVVSKPAVICFFVNRALDGETLTVYERHAIAELRPHQGRCQGVSAQGRAILDELEDGETGARTYEVASEEDPSVMAIAERIQTIAAEEFGRDVDVELVENPRSAETSVEDFPVDTSRIRDELGWEPRREVDASIRALLERGVS